MEPGEYEGLVAKASGGGTSAAIELLQAMRTHKVHQPELVLMHGGRVLGSAPRKFGNEIWTVLEQVFMAAIDLGADGWRDYCLKRLTKQFPASSRVERLKGIDAESKRDWSGAKAIYEKILVEKPEDTLVRKRLIAVHKQKGSVSETIEEINKYIDGFCVDPEVWHELAELYIEVGSLPRAVFCFEELMMANPRSLYYMLTYAELLYSTQDYELSRKYFSMACYLDDACLRGLWGLYACNIALAEKDKSKERMEELQVQNIIRLKATYKDAGGTHSKLAQAMLKDE
jgi:tetratricopeptide (TPR) repeat protein